MKILKEKGIDCVFRYTDEGRLYGATFIDQRTHSVLNGSRMGKAFSANALNQHFNTPIEERISYQEENTQSNERYHNSDTASSEQQQYSDAMPKGDGTEYRYSTSGTAAFLDALDFLNSDNPVTDAEEEAFRRRLQRKKKKRRGPRL